jgi:hypothetical protein
MTFSEGLNPDWSVLELKDAHGADVALGSVSVDPSDPRRITAPVRAKLPPGTYTVHWRAVGRDDRPASGSYIFELR